MDRSQIFSQFHQLLPYLQHCMTMPFDYTENYCNQHLGSADVVVAVAVVNDVVDAADIVGVLRRQRHYSDCYDTQHSDYCCCAVAAVDIEDFVRSVEHNCHIDRSIWAGYSVAAQQQRYLRDCEHFAKRYYECYFVAHNFVTDSCLGYYDDYYVLGMVVVAVVVVVGVVVDIFVDSLVVYVDDCFVMRTIVSYLVRAPGLIVADLM